ncbi:hypothetical protein GCM10010324_67790 [Streptomyces hiroshimensis]|uniref:Uncharacterized protein n=1 Tax=Streptomyces hiroshimensis TaxID=66424 RepID=A0ABQ2ZFG6_9ACTN|nr:hypothetical protein GCM10010324_67790 [Streptomyces hiroshimensis]
MSPADRYGSGRGHGYGYAYGCREGLVASRSRGRGRGRGPRPATSLPGAAALTGGLSCHTGLSRRTRIGAGRTRRTGARTSAPGPGPVPAAPGRAARRAAGLTRSRPCGSGPAGQALRVRPRYPA